MDTPLFEVLGTKNKAIFSVSPATTVSEAAAEMASKKIGAVLVREGIRTVGVFTERDGLYRVLAVGRDPKTTRVVEVMTREPLTVAPETTVGQAMRIMTERRIRRLPMVQGGEVVGLISIGDLVKWVTRENEQLVDYITGKYPG